MQLMVVNDLMLYSGGIWVSTADPYE